MGSQYGSVFQFFAKGAKYQSLKHQRPRASCYVGVFLCRKQPAKVS